MKIIFLMDDIKDIHHLYTNLNSDNGEHYNGTDYCKNVICRLSDWKNQYLGMQDRIANETFNVISPDDKNYKITFGINTYEEKKARLEVTIFAPETEDYDQSLENLKIALKNILRPDWEECTWLLDEQSAKLCKEIYEKAYMIENKLRAFASKILIHFIGVNWLRRAGLEKQADSVKNLQKEFTQRVPDFDDINTDFISMTLETLVGIMFKGVIYKDEVVLKRTEYDILRKICSKSNNVKNIAEFVKSKRTKEINLWTDLFSLYIDDPNEFELATNKFIVDRNHVAHSKILSSSSYKIMLKDLENVDSLISSADEKFDNEEASEEIQATWEAEREEEFNTMEYMRDRIAYETGMEILDDYEIENKIFMAIYDKLYCDIYQRYHLDNNYEVSDFFNPTKEGLLFSISCLTKEDLSSSIDVTATLSIDDNLGGDSSCTIILKKETEQKDYRAEIFYHNGNGAESETGNIIATDETRFNVTELDDFKTKLINEINQLTLSDES